MDLETVCRLYYRYKRRSDDGIRDMLKKVKIVSTSQTGSSGKYQQFELDQDLLNRVKEKPRNTSYSFELKTTDEPIAGLEAKWEIPFLVKSSSRFFLKPDIGEVFDQIYDFDYPGLCAIEIVEGSSKELPGTDGGHFVMTAKLYTMDKEAVSQSASHTSSPPSP